MDAKTRAALIHTYTLDDCISILAFGAPDLLEQIAEDVRFFSGDPKTLAKAKSAVREAVAREKRIN